MTVTKSAWIGAEEADTWLPSSKDGETVPVIEVIGYLEKKGKTSQQLEQPRQNQNLHLQLVPQTTMVRAMMPLISLWLVEVLLVMLKATAVYLVGRLPFVEKLNPSVERVWTVVACPNEDLPSNWNHRKYRSCSKPRYRHRKSNHCRYG